jgi:hypothetical protein
MTVGRKDPEEFETTAELSSLSHNLHAVERLGSAGQN